MIKALHHIGIASKNIDKDIGFFSLFGYTPDGEKRADASSEIQVQFLKADGQPDLELVANLNQEGPVSPHLQAKRKIFHFAYISDDINADAEKMIRENGGMFLVPITYVDEDNTDIAAWCYLAFRNSMIVELVQLKEKQ